jgi:hypothetical protein
MQPTGRANTQHDGQPGHEGALWQSVRVASTL